MNSIKRLKGLTPAVFQHPEDRASLQIMLEKIPLLPELTAKAIDFFSTRSQELKLLGNGIRVTDQSLPSIHKTFLRACEALDVERPPELYVTMGAVNAFCVGGEQMFLHITSNLIAVLEEDELQFVIGHELGHLLSGHAKYQALANLLTAWADGLLATLTLGLSKAVFSRLVQPLLFTWSRRAELTADRAGCLACQNPETAVRSLMVFAGLPRGVKRELTMDAIVAQAEAYRQAVESSPLDSLRELSMHMNLSHPFTIARVAELIDWVDDGTYREIIEADAAGMQRLRELADMDGRLQVLTTRMAATLSRWIESEYGVSRVAAKSAARGMIYHGTAPVSTPMARVFRVELHVQKTGSDDLAYQLVVAHISDDRPVKIVLEIPYETDWEYAPKDIREQVIKQGTKGSVFRLLYCDKE